MPLGMPVHKDPTIQPRNYVGQKVLSCSNAFIERLITRKTMGQLQAEIEIDNAMRRTLNWVQLTAIGLGCTIGE